MSVCVYIYGGHRGEKHALAGQKPAARCLKTDTSFVFRIQVIVGKMGR